MKNKIITDRNLHIIFGITLLGVMGVSSITPAFPKIIRHFGISTHQVGLLITVFTLPGVVLTPFLGILADRLGRKKILVPSIFLFGLAGGACGLTQDYHALLVFRFLQGSGAAALGSLNITLIGDLFSGRERMSAMGYNASILSIGTASYPAIGGVLAMLGWNFPFFFPLLAVPMGLWVLFSLNNPEPLQEQDLKTYLVRTFFSIWKKQVLGLFLLSILTFIILYGAMLTYIPIKLSDDFGAPPYLIGLILSVSSISTAITASQLGKISSRLVARRILLLVVLFYGLALLIIPVVPSLWLMSLPAVLFGVGMGMNIPTLQTLLVGSAPPEHRAAFMSVNGMVLRIGQTLGPLVIGVFYALGGIDAAFLSGACVAVLMGAIVLALIGKDQEGHRNH